MTDLNPIQERVASRPAEELCVSAAAGSGKTRALAWRYARAVEGGGEHAADEAIAITFTEKAAGELAERVRRLLVELGDRAGARSIESGWISTIHGLCARIVRRHALDVGRDPLARILSEVERGRLLRGAFDAACRTSGAGEVLCDAYGPAAVFEFATAALARLRTVAADARDVPEQATPDLRQALGSARGRLLETAAGFAALERRTSTALANEEACRDLARGLAALDPEAPDAPTRVRELAEDFSVAARGGSELVELVGDARRAVDALATAAAGVVAAPLQAAFVHLLAAFDETYEEAKGSRGAMDFDDLLLVALQILEQCPETAGSYARRFHSVMIDEFQDTDPVQARIVDAIAKGRLCTVGDERQAIYGFRYADVEVFRRRLLEAEPDRRATLDVNYRSHPEILAWANRTFSHEVFFGDEFLRLSAGRTDRGPDWASRVPRVEVVAVERRGWTDATARDAEIAVVTAAVVERIARGARPGDVALLLRSMTHVAAYAEALRACGVPASVESGQSMLESAEERAVIAALEVVANARDERALLDVLAGPLCGLSDRGLLVLARAGQQGRGLWDALGRPLDLEADDRERAERLRGLLERLRAERGRRALEDCILDIVHETGVDRALSERGVQGERARAALYALASIAGEYGRIAGPDVRGFVEHLARSRELGSRGPVSAAAEAPDAVRLMSVHAAKGLEFPFVVVPENGRSLSRRSPSILIDRTSDGPRIAAAAPAVLERGLPRGATEEWSELRDLIASRERAEEKRILYVACTRARDALFVTGTTRTDESPGDTPIDWLRSAGEGEAALRVDGPGDGIPTPAVLDLDRRERIAKSIDGPDGRVSAPRRPEPGIPQSDSRTSRGPVLSYTALREFARCPYRFYVRYVAGLGEARAFAHSAHASFGTAVHAVLALDGDGAVADSDLERIARAHGLGPAEFELLAQTTERLRQTPDVRRVAGIPGVQREAPFSFELGDVVLQGGLDLYARENDRAFVIDYKTGAPSEGRARERWLQADCYALAAFGDGATRVRVVFVYADGTRDAHEYAAEDADAARESLRASCEAIRTERFEPLEVYDAEVCPDCPAFGATCPVSEPSRVR